MEFTLEKQNIGAFVGFLGKDRAIIAPVQNGARFTFEQIEDPSEASREYPSTLLPPVKFIYPNNEKLLEFDLSDITKARAVAEATLQALLFVHPCDINAISLMDEILSEEPQDENYVARRNSTIIIGYECAGPCGTDILCFDKGTHNASKGFDIFISDLGDKFLISTGTEAGDIIVASSGLFKTATREEKLKRIRLTEEREQRFKNALEKKIDPLSHHLKASLDDAFWEEEGEKCLSCGACNIVCPTCYCFDTSDEVDVTTNKGVRIRKWDSCQLHGFCKVASGENFRSKASSRIKHRVFKKEVYLKKRFGKSGCVGCGRCVRHCIADISIIDIYNKALKKEVKEEEK